VRLHSRPLPTAAEKALNNNPLPNPLYSVHEQTDAEYQSYGNVNIVATFGPTPLEYAAIHKSAGLMDMPQRGIIEVNGPARLPFLNNLLTNETWSARNKAGLTAGQGLYAFTLTRQGRIIADLSVIERGDRTLLDVDGRLVDAIAAELEKYHFAEKLSIESRVGALHQLGMFGLMARQLIEQASGQQIGDLTEYQSFELNLFGRQVIVWRDDSAGLPGYRLIVPTADAEIVWRGLLDSFAGGLPRTPTLEELRDAGSPKHSLRAIGWAAYNSARIEAGRPIFGIDFDDTVLPAETGLVERAVSFNKGCYLGQEVVARMASRAQIARRIVGLRLQGDTLPIAGAILQDAEGNEVGAITSSTISPVLSGTAICLAMVKRPHYDDGVTLRVPAEGAMREASVVPLPFLKQT
jgi:folate-binding protein YgfZ